MSTSLQRLGDNPRDHDGQFHGLTESTAAVSGMRPDVAPSAPRPTSSDYKPWKIYPTPPGPHWHWKNPNQAVLKEGHAPPARDDFYYETCEIPGKQDWVFKLDERGVYQVYDTAPSMSSQLFLVLVSHRES
jgi:AMP deaminase